MTRLKIVQGLRIAECFPDDAVVSALAYQARPGDVFITSYPKSGTTWVQYIVYSILHSGVPFDDVLQLIAESPCLELCGAEAANCDPRPPTIKTHLPFDQKKFSPLAKYIYVVRNPYDVCVSLYHHIRMQTVNDEDLLDMNTILQHLVNGTWSYGRFFEDNLLPRYERRHDPNVLFLTYEDLHADIEGQVTRIAYFLGKEYGQRISKDPGLLKRVTDMTSRERMRPIFRDYMKANLEFVVQQRTRTGITVPESLLKLLEFLTYNPPRHEFVREARVKGYKDMLSADQQETLRKWISEKTAASDVMKLWSAVDFP